MRWIVLAVTATAALIRSFDQLHLLEGALKEARLN